ncbi:MAG TPA: hypothetical protein VJ793_13950 [Anaerolineae bacterium]|nr:hypothetical protein [Anaerolineae bacterium]
MGMEPKSLYDLIVDSIAGLNLADKRRLLVWLREQIALADTGIGQTEREIREAHVAYQSTTFDITQTQTWQLCGTFEIAQPDSEFIVGRDIQGQIITNYAEHVDDVLYRRE